MSLETNNDTRADKSNILGFFKKHLILTGLLILIGSGVAFAMSDKPEIYTWRYKTTIIVDTPEGEKIGSAVRQSTVEFYKNPGRTPKVTTTGEAAVVDLGKRGIFFEVMGTEPYMTVFYALPGPPGLTHEGQKYYSTLKNAKAKLNTGNLKKDIFTQYPTMVTFKDMKDPKSIELVYRSEAMSVPNQADYDFKITDNFEKLFGAGVKLKDVTVEMTDEPVTWAIDKNLTWLKSYYNKMFDGQEYNTITSKLPLANSMSAGSFSTGKE